MADHFHTDRIPSGARGYERFPGVITERARTSERAWRRARTAPTASPNVILILVDDLGFSDISPFGGEIHTPNLEELAATGVKFTNYHTNPVCSPSRASLLTGLNPHRAGFSDVAHADPGFPHSTLELPEDAPTIAEAFQQAGYFTAAIGKWHLCKESNLHDGADQSSWPTQRGFDRYFGHLDGFTQLFHPHRLTRDNTSFVPEFADEDYLTDVFTDEALRVLQTHRANEETKPFFLYFAHTAVHAPLQAKVVDIEKYRHTYQAGWQKIREQRFEKQRKLGVIPPDAELSQSEGIPNWDDLSTLERERFARYMQVYAAAVDSVDQSLGRLTDYLRQSGEYENTIIAFTSDNGASGEGGIEGTRSYFSKFIDLPELPPGWTTDHDTPVAEIGGPASAVHYPRGWANVSATPYRYYKASVYGGGVRAPLLVSWPKQLADSDRRGTVVGDFCYVSDLGLALAELAGVPMPQERRGNPALERDGDPRAILVGIRDGVAEAARPRVQHWEYLGNRGLVRGNMKLVAQHQLGSPLSDADWRLYDLSSDPTEMVDLSSRHPELLAELTELWTQEAWRNTVFPVNDDAAAYELRPPSEARLSRPVRLRPGITPLERYRSAQLIQERECEILVRIEPEGDRPMRGVILAHGDQGGGYLLRMSENRVEFVYNEYGRRRVIALACDDRAPQEIRIRFTPVPNVRLDVELEVSGQRGVMHSVMRFIGLAPFSGISIGMDAGNRVDREPFGEPTDSTFRGILHEVTYQPGKPYLGEPARVGALLAEQARLYD